MNSSEPYLLDWPAWLRHGLAEHATAFAWGEALRAEMGDAAYWRAHGEGHGAPWRIVRWAQAHPEPLSAWGECVRADWLLRALAQGRADVRTRVLCTSAVAHRGLAYVSYDGPRVGGVPLPDAALHAAVGWARGEADLAEAVQLSHAARQAAGRSLDPATRLALEAVSAPARIAQGESGVEAAHAALAAGPDPDLVTREHRCCAELIRAWRWPLTEPTDLLRAEPDLQASWAWLEQRVPIVELTTSQLLASYSMRWALVGGAPTPGAGYSPLHSAIAERVAASRHPGRILDELVSFLAPAPAPAGSSDADGAVGQAPVTATNRVPSSSSDDEATLIRNHTGYLYGLQQT